MQFFLVEIKDLSLPVFLDYKVIFRVCVSSKKYPYHFLLVCIFSLFLLHPPEFLKGGFKMDPIPTSCPFPFHKQFWQVASSWGLVHNSQPGCPVTWLQMSVLALAPRALASPTIPTCRLPPVVTTEAALRISCYWVLSFGLKLCVSTNSEPGLTSPSLLTTAPWA